jgi:hypothetical protein
VSCLYHDSRCVTMQGSAQVCSKPGSARVSYSRRGRICNSQRKMTGPYPVRTSPPSATQPRPRVCCQEMVSDTARLVFDACRAGRGVLGGGKCSGRGSLGVRLVVQEPLDQRLDGSPGASAKVDHVAVRSLEDTVGLRRQAAFEGVP